MWNGKDLNNYLRYQIMNSRVYHKVKTREPSPASSLVKES